MTRTETASSAAEIADLSDAAAILYGGRYELIDLVGAGGAGTVYRARDIELDEIVALKVLRKELVRSKELIERFRSEVKLARRVTHRNVARRFDIGEHEGERFLTMEFVEGQMLSARLNIGADGNGRPLPNQLVLEVTKQVCAGLAAAQEIQAGELVTLDLAHPLCRSAKVSLLARKGRPMSAACDGLLREIRGKFSVFKRP